MDTTSLTPDDVTQLYEAAGNRRDQLVADLIELVGMESPSGDVSRIDAIADVIAGRWEGLGARVARHNFEAVGTHLQISWSGPHGTPPDAPPALIVGHLDTVHRLGALERNPLRAVDGRLHGPGSQDMKGGLVIAWHAVDLLRNRGVALARPVTVLITADEEVGSLTSRELIEEHARRSAYALVLEGAAADGSAKTARKGVGLFEVTVRGVAAHAGVHFDAGVNAAVGLAEVIPQIAGLTNIERGTTVNVGVVNAGTVVNVVPELAVARIDVRFTDREDAQRVESALHALRTDQGELTVTGGINRPAMIHTEAIGALFSRARDLVTHVDQLTEMAVGGASDGNFTAAVGTPTLDGLGPFGAGLHTDGEYVQIDSLATRTGLIATLLADL